MKNIIEEMEAVRHELDRLAEGKRTHRIELESPRLKSDYYGPDSGKGLRERYKSSSDYSSLYLFTVRGVRTDASNYDDHTVCGHGRTLEGAVVDYTNELKRRARKAT